MPSATMSANLLVDFDSFYSQSGRSNAPHIDESRSTPQHDSGEHAEARNTGEESSGNPAHIHPNPWQQESPAAGLDADRPTTLDIYFDDDWGEFETGQAFSTTQTQIEPVDSSFNAHKAYDDDARIQRESAEIPYRENPKHNFSASIDNYVAKEPNRPPRDENVLFDVDDEVDEDEDDFGDFETAEKTESTTVPGQKATNISAVNLLETLIDFGGDTNEQVNTPPIYQTYQPFHDFKAPVDAFGLITESGFESADTEATNISLEARSVGREQAQTESLQLDNPWAADEWNSTQHIDSKSPFDPQSEHHTRLSKSESILESNEEADLDTHGDVTEFVSADLPAADDPWEDFEDDAAHDDNDAATSTSQPRESINVHDLGQSQGEVNADELWLRLPVLLHLENEKASAVPPSNLPPPALLLSLFPPIFAKVQSDLYDPVSKQDDTSRMILSLENTKEFLNSYLSIAKVLAYIIAGRKLRWKRDTILSQSMRIGPAASGKGGGMKLAGIDKGESMREEKEVADIVRLWRAQLGRLRSVISAIGVTKIVPDVTEALPVRLAQPSEGAVTAPKPCALCGLKRNERVPKVDADVHDSFGEFWNEHWGHMLCMNFWYSYEGELSAR